METAVGTSLGSAECSREVLGQYHWDRVESCDIRGCTMVSFQWTTWIDRGLNLRCLTDIRFGCKECETGKGSRWPVRASPLRLLCIHRAFCAVITP